MGTNAAPEVSRLIAEMLYAEATESDDPFAGVDDDENERDMNELVVDDVD